MIPRTMKAVRLHEFGGPEVLHYDDVGVPRPGRDEVLVQVVAAGVNPPDWYAREGMPDVPEGLLPPLDLPLIPGTDVSGAVAAVGDDVAGLAVGDDVFGLLRFPVQMQSGGYAQYVTAPATDLARTPARIGHTDAAGLPMAALTAWQFLVDDGMGHISPFQPLTHRPMAIGPGATVLVNGAAGGVGHIAVQLATWLGAQVVAVASGGHRSFLHELGVDRFVDYTVTHPAEVVEGVDLVLDTVGGAASSTLLPVLRPGGAIYPVYPAPYDPRELERRGVTTSTTQVRSSGRQLSRIAELVDEGSLRVHVESTYRLADARLAHERAGRGHLRGKLVLSVG